MTTADRITALEAKVKRTLTDHGRMLWRDDVDGHCPYSGTPMNCFEYGETVRCSPCAIKQSLAEGVEPAMPDHTYSPEVARLRRQVTALEAMCETLAGALESIEEYWNRDRNDAAMHNACWYAIETAAEALTQYRAMKEKNDG